MQILPLVFCKFWHFYETAACIYSKSCAFTTEQIGPRWLRMYMLRDRKIIIPVGRQRLSPVAAARARHASRSAALGVESDRRDSASTERIMEWMWSLSVHAGACWPGRCAELPLGDAPLICVHHNKTQTPQRASSCFWCCCRTACRLTCRKVHGDT